MNRRKALVLERQNHIETFDDANIVNHIKVVNAVKDK